MDEKAVKARRAYKRKWYREHPEKIQEYQERYWLKKAAEMGMNEKQQDEQNAITE